MKRNDGTNEMVDHNQAMWGKLPRTGQLVRALDINSVVGVKGAVPDSQTYMIGPTTTPMPTPTPPPPPEPTEAQTRSSNPVDSSGRTIDEVLGIGPKYTRRLAQGGIGSLPALASAVAIDVAQMLSISEVKAMGFIDEAGRLLQSE